MLNFNYKTQADITHRSFQEDFLKNQLQKFKNTIESNEIGFFRLTEDAQTLKSAKKVFEKFKHKKHFVQIGIGGSALGPQMLVSALQKDFSTSFTFLDNTDSDYIQRELRKINLNDSIFYVVSKSGGTAETIACFSIVKNLLLQNGIKEAELGNYFVFCTDPASGQLRSYVIENNFISLEVPSNIGGRFSVLTHVGLLPALFAGINIDDLFTGAQLVKDQILSEDISKNEMLQTAAHISYLYIEKEVDQTVMMPYSSLLKDFSAWFIQLWAESLGKFSHEKNMSVGLTPIPAYGATDQHAQMQLFMEGPANKVLFLIEVDKRENDFNLNAKIQMDSAQKLAPFSMNQLLKAELYGTLKALEEEKKNVIHIQIPSLNEKSLGALVMYFESLTALMGHYLLIDPFNQPGVEKGKIYAYEYLNNSQ